MRTIQRSKFLALASSTLLLAACGGKQDYGSTATPAGSAPATTTQNQQTLPVDTVSRVAGHHSVLGGAVAGAAAGHVLGHHAIAGAAVGALIQHERNKKAAVK